MNDGNELYSNHHLTYYDSISDILIRNKLTILLKLLLLENKKIEYEIEWQKLKLLQKTLKTKLLYKNTTTQVKLLFNSSN